MGKLNKNNMRNLRNKVRRIVQEELSHNGMVNNERYSRANTIVEAAGKEAMGIAALTGTRGVAVQNFIDDNNLNAKKLFNYLKKGNLSDRMDFITALSGNPNNPYQTKIIKLFSESVITEGISDGYYFVEYGRSISTLITDKRNLTFEQAIRRAQDLAIELQADGRLGATKSRYVGVSSYTDNRFAIAYVHPDYISRLDIDHFDGSYANYNQWKKKANRYIETGKTVIGSYEY